MKQSDKCAALVIYVSFLMVGIQTGYGAEAQTFSAREDARGNGSSITISKGIEMLLKDSRLIKAASFDNEMSYQDSLLSRSPLFPQMNTTFTKSFFKFQPASKFDSQRVNTSEKEPVSYGFDVYQTLFDFGKSLSRYRASKELWNAVKARTESVKRVATLEFIVVYFNLLEAEKMITVSEKEVESLKAHLNDAELLYEQGAAVKNDLLAVKVRFADAAQKFIEARNQREVAAARLNTILALPIREKTTVQDIEMQLPQFPEMEDAFKTAQTQRPEVVFYENQIRASLSREKAKSVENFPTIFVDGGYAYTQNKYQVHQDNVSVALGAKMHFYDGGAAKAELSKERAQQKQLQEQKNKLVEDIKFEIEDSFFGLKNACEKVSVAKDALAQAEENVRFYRVKYKSGSATSTEVLEAITLHTKALTNYFSDDYELKREYAHLMYSMGIDLALVYEKMESVKNGPEKQ